MAVLLIGVDAGDLLYIQYIGAMGADELVGVERLLEVAHRFIFQKSAVVCMDLDVVVGGFQVMDVFDGDDLYFAAGLDDDAVLLCRGLGGGVEEGAGGVGGGCVGRSGCGCGAMLVGPFADGLVEAIFIKGL